MPAFTPYTFFFISYFLVFDLTLAFMVHEGFVCLYAFFQLSFRIVLCVSLPSWLYGTVFYTFHPYLKYFPSYCYIFPLSSSFLPLFLHCSLPQSRPSPEPVGSSSTPTIPSHLLASSFSFQYNIQAYPHPLDFPLNPTLTKTPVCSILSLNVHPPPVAEIKRATTINWLAQQLHSGNIQLAVLTVSIPLVEQYWVWTRHPELLDCGTSF